MSRRIFAQKQMLSKAAAAFLVAYLSAALVSAQHIAIYRPSTGFIHQRFSLTAGQAERAFFFGFPGAISYHPLFGDWDGDGIHTPGGFLGANATWYIQHSQVLNLRFRGAFFYGAPGDKPVVGDWDGDGRDGIGLFRRKEDGSAEFFLRFDPLSWPIVTNIYVRMADVPADAHPVAGHWFNMRRGEWDTVGFFSPSRGTFRLMRSLYSGGYVDSRCGPVFADSLPVVADWDSNGYDGLGVYNSQAFWLKQNIESPTQFDIFFPYGAKGDRPLAGRFLR